ncbi:MAG TPA: AMP-binding protein [Mycobacteriales bacterium]|nr:AMP-binding protein [Mycobacteriales bacterium]
MTTQTEALRELVRRAAAQHPYFARKYAGLDLDGDFDLAVVPEMTREDVTASALKAARTVPRPTGAYLFTSGGSTAEPKIAWIPCEMHLPALLPHWRPLGPDDVFANLAMPGRLWSAHYFYNRVAEHCGADVIGLGHVAEDELAQWLGFLRRHGTTALAGTPSQLASVLRTGHPLLGQLRAAIFFGEACDPELLRLRDSHAPHLGLWGNYGSTETWVIGHNGPDCAVDTFHVLPYQHVELVDGAVLVSTLHEAAVSPVIRYRIGDRAELAECRCGRGGLALRVLGREGALIKFAGTLVSPWELVELARIAPGVQAAQAALVADGPAEVLEIRLVGSGADAGAVRERLLGSQIDLRFALRGEEDTFRVRLVDRLETSSRTAKTPTLVRQ